MTARSAERRPPREVDLLVVGSGPVGASVAATVARLRPGTSILVVDAGASLTEPAGSSLRGLSPQRRRRLDRSAVDLLSALMEGQATTHEGLASVGLRTCVGGMASIWSAAVPRPMPWETPDVMSGVELGRRLDQAERVVGTGASKVPEPELVLRTRARLAAFADAEGRGAGVRRMPTAEVHRRGRSVPTGVVGVLGPARRAVLLRDRSLCRQVHVDGGRARSAEIVDLPTGAVRRVGVRTVAVAGNAFRTPQLLWASGVRPAALGRHLHEHPMVNAVAVVPVRGASRPPPGPELHDRVVGRSWLPSGPTGGWAHAQVVHLTASADPCRPDRRRNGPAELLLGWYVAQDVEPDNRLDFDAALGDDQFALPVPRVHYRLSPGDHRRIDDAVAELLRVEDAGFAAFVDGGRPTVAPRGMSRHFLGTTRMGWSAHDSVCDESGRVWGCRNLFVAGTGVIGWPTSCNPTLTAMAHACRAGEEIARLLEA